MFTFRKRIRHKAKKSIRQGQTVWNWW